MMYLYYICPKCGTTNTIHSFWKWLITPHIGTRKYLKCSYCRKKSYMPRKDHMRYEDGIE